MKTRVLRVGRYALAAAASIPLFQAAGCYTTSLLDAVSFEVSNVFAALAFDYTQVIVENLLDL